MIGRRGRARLRMRVCDGRWQLIEGAEDRSEDVLRREKTDKSGLSKSATNREDRGGGEFHRYLSIRYLSPPLGLPFFSASSYLLIGYSKISETRRDRREARRDGEKEEEAQEEEKEEEEEEEEEEEVEEEGRERWNGEREGKERYRRRWWGDEASAAKWGGRDELSRADTLERVGVN